MTISNLPSAMQTLWARGPLLALQSPQVWGHILALTTLETELGGT